MKLVEISDGKKALVEKTARRIKDALDDLSIFLQDEFRKMNAEERCPLPFRTEIHPHPDDSGTSVLIFPNEKYSDSIHAELYDEIRECLKDKGFLDSILPVNISLRKMHDAYLSIHVRAS